MTNTHMTRRHPFTVPSLGPGPCGTRRTVCESRPRNLKRITLAVTRSSELGCGLAEAVLVDMACVGSMDAHVCLVQYGLTVPACNTNKHRQRVPWRDRIPHHSGHRRLRRPRAPWTAE